MAFCAVLVAIVTPAGAITVTLDYTYDTGNFFGNGNPQGATAGAQARAALETAATFFSNILNDTFSPIVVPPPLHSSQFSTVVSWEFKMRFDDPSSNDFIELTNPTVASDQYLIFAGARDWSGITAGVGGPGGRSVRNYVTGDGRLTQPELNQATLTTENFFNAVTTRGEPSGFSNWGGTISFDNSNRTWHFNHLTSPSGNVSDFYSVAIHELAHALGFGSQGDGQTATPWETHVSGSLFFGANAQDEFGGPVPLSTDLAHWAPGTTSVVYGGTTPQETSMDPDLQNGTRNQFTELDAAAMQDIGWEVIPLLGLFGDYNDNGVVDAADYVVWRKYLGQSVTIPNDETPGMVTARDYTVWRGNFGNALSGGGGAVLVAAPEPAGATLAVVGGLVVFLARRKRRG